MYLLHILKAPLVNTWAGKQIQQVQRTRRLPLSTIWSKPPSSRSSSLNQSPALLEVKDSSVSIARWPVWRKGFKFIHHSVPRKFSGQLFDMDYLIILLLIQPQSTVPYHVSWLMMIMKYRVVHTLK